MTCRNPLHVPCDRCNGTGVETEKNLTNHGTPGTEPCWACCGSGCRSLTRVVPAADTATPEPDYWTHVPGWDRNSEGKWVPAADTATEEES